MPHVSRPPRRNHARVLSLALLCPLLGGVASAQEEPDPPEVRAVHEAREDAKEAARKALGELEGFGRESRAPLTPAQARRRALARINGVRPERRRREEIDPDQAQRELSAFREAILRRLRELDPRKYPEPEDPVESNERPKLAVYDVADLINAAPDHLAPTVGLAVGSGSVVDFDDGEETSQPVLEPDVILEILESELESVEVGGASSIEISGARMVVRHTKAAHAKIREVLARLRSVREGQLLVELRFYKLPREVFASVAERASRLTEGDEQILAKAVAAKRASLLSTHRVVATDGQRVVVRQGGSRAVVADVEVNQTGVIPVLNPVVRNVNEGLVLELRGLANRDERLVHLDMSLTRAKLTKGGEVRKLAGIEVELPQLSLTRTAASLIVPFGQGAFMAGSLATGSDEDAVVVYTRVRLIKGRK
jgi:hypothetical protein